MTRRTWLGLAAAGIGLGPGVLAAGAERRGGRAAEGGRIIALAAHLGGQKEITGLVGIDPETGVWNLLYALRQQGGGRLSPDGKTLAYVDFVDRKNGVWTCDLKGDGAPRRVAEVEIPGAVCWSPDGKQLVVGAQRRGPGTQLTWPNEVRRMNADGSDRIELPIPKDLTLMDWSSDGKWFLAAHIPKPGEPARLADLIRPDGTGRRPLFKGPGALMPACFSPDGLEVVYAVYAYKRGGSLWIAPVDGGEALRLPLEEDVLAQAVWSPDGKRLALHCLELKKAENGDLGLPRPDQAVRRVEIIDRDGKGRRRLPLPDGILSLLAWR